MPKRHLACEAAALGAGELQTFAYEARATSVIMQSFEWLACHVPLRDLCMAVQTNTEWSRMVTKVPLLCLQ
jgi:hypothetical protein